MELFIDFYYRFKEIKHFTIILRTFPVTPSVIIYNSFIVIIIISGVIIKNYKLL